MKFDKETLALVGVSTLVVVTAMVVTSRPLSTFQLVFNPDGYNRLVCAKWSARLLSENEAGDRLRITFTSWGLGEFCSWYRPGR
jgi:hypothetical protein